jgi:ABC-type multidrug transport system ATPase subunit
MARRPSELVLSSALSSPSNPAIVFSGVSKRFGTVEALAGVSFEVRPGELAALIGHNGAGKTTALRLLCGQLPATSGELRVAGRVVCAGSARQIRHLVGYTPENPVLYEYLTAREFLTFVADVRADAARATGETDSPEPARGAVVDAALSLADLGGDADRLIREYSQGMRRRTALAAAFLGHPPVLVLDEALNGLDPPSAARVREELRTRCREGAAVLLSTHALETVERVADRVIMLAGGRLAADVRVADLGGESLEQLFLSKLASAGRGV